jgi:FkbM family methyltransferase
LSIAVSSWREVVRLRLDRPGGRALLGAAASLWCTARNREPCRIRWQDGVWIHRYHGATIPYPRAGGAPRPDMFTAAAREICLYGYEPRPGDVVFDVGAGIGRTTLLFSQLVGRTGRVVAVEAHPVTFRRLVRLCALNDLGNVVALQFAAWDREGELAIGDSEHYSGNSVVDPTEAGLAVPTRRLDDVANELQIPHVDFLKMNIEGAEEFALRGMGRLLERTRHACISCHDFLAERGGVEQLRTKAPVREFLVEQGFQITSRDDEAAAWTRDYLYGVNRRAI